MSKWLVSTARHCCLLALTIGVASASAGFALTSRNHAPWVSWAMSILVLGAVGLSAVLIRQLAFRVSFALEHQPGSVVLGNDLHDTALQSLILAHYVAETTVEDSHPLLTHLRRAQQETRHAILRTRIPDYGPNGLGEALGQLAWALSASDSLRITWRWDIPTTLLLPKNVVDLLYRAALECLAHATHRPEQVVTIRLRWVRREVVLRVEGLPEGGLDGVAKRVKSQAHFLDSPAVSTRTCSGAVVVRVPIHPHSAPTSQVIVGTPSEEWFAPNPPLRIEPEGLGVEPEELRVAAEELRVEKARHLPPLLQQRVTKGQEMTGV